MGANHLLYLGVQRVLQLSCERAPALVPAPSCPYAAPLAAGRGSPLRRQACLPGSELRPSRPRQPYWPTCMAPLLQDVVRLCDARPACQAVSFGPRGRGNLTGPLGVLKGASGGQRISLSFGRANPSAYTLVKSSHLEDGSSSAAAPSPSGGRGTSAGIIAGELALGAVWVSNRWPRQASATATSLQPAFRVACVDKAAVQQCPAPACCLPACQPLRQPASANPAGCGCRGCSRRRRWSGSALRSFARCLKAAQDPWTTEQQQSS
jgi:hypothetical protein